MMSCLIQRYAHVSVAVRVRVRRRVLAEEDGHRGAVRA